MSAVTLEWIKQDQTFNVITDNDVQRGQIATDSNGNSYVVYFTNGTVSGGSNTGNLDIVVAKINNNGNTEWVVQDGSFNTSVNDYRPSVSIGPDGFIYVAFYTQGTTSGNTSTGNQDIAIIKLSSSGITQWVKQSSLFNTVNYESRPAISVSADGSIYVVFQTASDINNNNNDGKIVVIKLNSDGDLIWLNNDESFNTDDSEYPPTIATDTNNNVYVTYYSSGTVSGGTNTGNEDIIVFKLNSDGTLVWAKQEPRFNTDEDDFYPVITINNQNDIFVAFITDGTTSGNTNVGSSDIAVMKMNTDGDVLWLVQNAGFNTTEGDAESYHFGITSDNNGNVYVAYHTYGSVEGQDPNPEGEAIIIVTKLTGSGSVAWVYQMPLNVSSNSNYSPHIDIDANGNLYVVYWKRGGEVSGGSLYNSDNDNIVIFKLSQGVTNTFPAYINNYITLGPTLIYTKEAVQALLNDQPLPETTRVSWAPNGISAGSLLRNLGRKRLGTSAESHPLYRYRFQQVQLINGVSTEGISGAPSDIQSWNSGYICTWSSDGIAPAF